MQQQVLPVLARKQSLQHLVDSAKFARILGWLHHCFDQKTFTSDLGSVKVYAAALTITE